MSSAPLVYAAASDAHKAIDKVFEIAGGTYLTLYCQYLDSPNHLLAAVRFLCQTGIDVNVCNRKGSNALLALLDNRAIIYRHPKIAEEIVKTLISYGLNVHHINHEGCNALWKLLRHGCDPGKVYPIAKLLLACGMDINYAHPKEKEYDPVGWFFLNRLSMPSFVGCNAIAAQEAQDMHELVKLLVQHGLSRCHPLFRVLFFDKIKHQQVFAETVKFLADSRCNINHTTLGINSVNAVCFQQFPMPRESNLPNLIDFLIRQGADVNEIVPVNGENALISFLGTIPLLDAKALEVIASLCNNGINVNHSFVCKDADDTDHDNHRIDALRLACKLQGKFSATDVLSIARILVAHGARITPIDDNQEDVLLYFFSVRLNLFEDFLSNEDDEDVDDDEDEDYDDIMFDVNDDCDEAASQGEASSAERDFRLAATGSFQSWLKSDSVLSRHLSEIDASDVGVGQQGERNNANDGYFRDDGDASPPSDDVDEWQGWYELIKFLLDNGANVNGRSIGCPDGSALTMFLRYYGGNDFVKILELMCKYAPLDVNTKLFTAKDDKPTETLTALDLLSRNQHQRERFHEAALLLIREGLNQGCLTGARNRNNAKIRRQHWKQKKHSSNVLLKINNKSHHGL